MNTTHMCDSLQAVCSGRMADVCLSCVNQSGTNWQKVAIIAIICISFLAIFWISINYIWKKSEQNAQKEVSEKRRIQEKEDREYKQLAELQERLLKHLESQVYTIKYNEIDEDKTYKEVKELNTEAAQKYKQLLDDLIKEHTQTQSKKDDQEK